MEKEISGTIELYEGWIYLVHTTQPLIQYVLPITNKFWMMQRCESDSIDNAEQVGKQWAQMRHDPLKEEPSHLPLAIRLRYSESNVPLS